MDEYVQYSVGHSFQLESDEVLVLHRSANRAWGRQGGEQWRAVYACTHSSDSVGGLRFASNSINQQLCVPIFLHTCVQARSRQHCTSSAWLALGQHCPPHSKHNLPHSRLLRPALLGCCRRSLRLPLAARSLALALCACCQGRKEGRKFSISANACQAIYHAHCTPLQACNDLISLFLMPQDHTASQHS